MLTPQEAETGFSSLLDTIQENLETTDEALQTELLFKAINLGGEVLVGVYDRLDRIATALERRNETIS